MGSEQLWSMCGGGRGRPREGEEGRPRRATLRYLSSSGDLSALSTSFCTSSRASLAAASACETLRRLSACTTALGVLAVQ